MNSVQIEQKSYEMPPRDGVSIAHFLTVADIERSARYYEKVFGARILSLGDGNAPGYVQIANTWLILNVGGGPTPDKPSVTLSVPDPSHINSFLNIRVADIQACYKLWTSRAPSSSRSRWISTASGGATSGILTVILSRSDRASRALCTVNGHGRGIRCVGLKTQAHFHRGLSPRGGLMDHYDAIVIGSGQAGTPLSVAFAEAGRKTALVESRHVGGTCINVGCTPTKTMVASARIAYLARRTADYGIHCGPVDVDLGEVHRRKQAIVDDFRTGEQRRLKDAENVELISGEAPLHRSQGRRGEAHWRRHADIDCRCHFHQYRCPAGSTPHRGDRSSESARLHLDHGTAKSAATFAGVGGRLRRFGIGQMFRRFGSAVTVVQHGKQLLGREDPDVAAEVCKLLESDGIEILLETEAVGVHAGDSGVGLELRGPTGERTVTGSHLLVAIGRVPNSEQLNLAAAGVNVDARGFIPVDDRLQTNVAGVYALGDVKGGPAFTHISYDDYRIIRNNLLRGGQSSTRDRLVPYTVYIDPQLGRIGLTEQKRGHKAERFAWRKSRWLGSPARWRRRSHAASSRPWLMPKQNRSLEPPSWPSKGARSCQCFRSP